MSCSMVTYNCDITDCSNKTKLHLVHFLLLAFCQAYIRQCWLIIHSINASTIINWSSSTVQKYSTTCFIICNVLKHNYTTNMSSQSIFISQYMVSFQKLVVLLLILKNEKENQKVDVVVKCVKAEY